MFKFNFDVEDGTEQSTDVNHTAPNNGSHSVQAVVPEPFTELSLADAVRLFTAHPHSVTTNLGQGLVEQPTIKNILLLNHDPTYQWR